MRYRVYKHSNLVQKDFIVENKDFISSIKYNLNRNAKYVK